MRTFQQREDIFVHTMTVIVVALLLAAVFVGLIVVARNWYERHHRGSR